MELIHADILHHLKTKRAIGEKHVPYDGLHRGFPAHLGKQVKKAADELIRENFIIRKPTSYGLQISLNPQMLSQIDEIISARK